jgi:hypothetical protein
VRENPQGGTVSTSANDPILLCYDRSAGARRAIETAAELFPGRKAIVLHIWRPIAIAAAAYGATAPLADFDESELERAAKELADEGAAVRAPRASTPRRASPTRPTRAPGMRS